MAADTVTVNIDTLDQELWDKIVAAADNQLPQVSATDNGDLLGVSSGKWAKVDPPAAELPAVTASDNGSLLGVSGGAWAKVADKSPLIVAGTVDGTSVTITTALADIKAAYDAGRLVALKMGDQTATLCYCAEHDSAVVLAFSTSVYDGDDSAVLNYSVTFAGTTTGTLTVTKLAAAT